MTQKLIQNKGETNIFGYIGKELDYINLTAEYLNAIQV